MLTSRISTALRCRPSTLARSISSSANQNLTQVLASVPKPQLSPPRPDYTRLLSDPSATERNALLRQTNLPDSHIPNLIAFRNLHLNLEKELNSARREQGEATALLKTATDKNAAVEAARKLKERVKSLEAEYSAAEAKTLKLSLSLPNFTHPSSPEKAKVVDTFGPKPLLPSDERDHVHVARHFGWLEQSSTALSVGARWPYLVGAFAQLEYALVSLAVDIASKRGYVVVSPPDVVSLEVALRTGFEPEVGVAEEVEEVEKGEQQVEETKEVEVEHPKKMQKLGPTYRVEADEGESKLVLSGGVEVPLAGMFANRTLPKESLPVKIVGMGRAYRTEDGARGLETQGLYRVHEFTNVELFTVGAEEESDGLLDEIVAIQKEVAEALGLSARMLDMPAEELGVTASRQFDMEAWMPGRGGWGEVASAANCTDYVSRRLAIKYKDEKPKFAHTVHGTVASIPRLIVALVENGVVLENGLPVRIELPKILERFWLASETSDGFVRFV